MGALWLDGGRSLVSHKWLEIDLHEIDTRIRAGAQGCRGERALPHTLGPDVDVEPVSRFTQQVREAATRHESLGSVLENAQTLYRALFQGGLRDVLVGLRRPREACRSSCG